MFGAALAGTPVSSPEYVKTRLASSRERKADLTAIRANKPQSATITGRVRKTSQLIRSLTWPFRRVSLDVKPSCECFLVFAT